jgi:hypothetical protein
MNPRFERHLWLIPVALFFFYVQLAGYPLPTTFLVAFGLFLVSGVVGLLPVRALYGAGLALLICCPLWMITENYALLGRNISVLRMAMVMHMAVPSTMAALSADASFVLFCAGLFAEVTRRSILGRE